MHALGAMMHDFAHYRFIRNKQLSDWIGDIFLAWPIGTTVAGYRRNHLAHHRYVNTDRDPDWSVKLGTRVYTFPQQWRVAVTNFLGYFVAISSVRDMRMAFPRLHGGDAPSNSRIFGRVLFYVVFGIAIIYSGVIIQYIFYWAIPYFTLFFSVIVCPFCCGAFWVKQWITRVKCPALVQLFHIFGSGGFFARTTSTIIPNIIFIQACLIIICRH